MLVTIITSDQFLRGNTFIERDAKILREQIAQEEVAHQKRVAKLTAKLRKLEITIAEEEALRKLT